jgi:uncharacterized metal-binding protein
MLGEWYYNEASFLFLSCVFIVSSSRHGGCLVSALSGHLFLLSFLTYPIFFYYFVVIAYVVLFLAYLPAVQMSPIAIVASIGYICPTSVHE